MAKPSDQDWAQIAAVVVMVDDLGAEDFRVKVKKLSRKLEREGLAAHRNADLLEGRCRVERVFTKDVPLWEHTRAAILSKLSVKFTPRHWLIVAAHLHALDEIEPNDTERLRQQAARLLDAALHLQEMVCWYEIRSAAIGARDLVNDTIVAIMIEWNYIKHKTTAEQIAAQLRARKISLSTTSITGERLKTAMRRHRVRIRDQTEAELTGPFSLPLLAPRR